MANSVDTDQTGPREQSDLGLHCLLRPIFPIFSIWVWMVIMRFKLILVLQSKTLYEVQVKVTDLLSYLHDGQAAVKESCAV